MFIPSKRSSNLICHICLSFVSKDKTLRLFRAFFYNKTRQCKMQTTDWLRTIVFRVRKQWDYFCHVLICMVKIIVCRLRFTLIANRTHFIIKFILVESHSNTFTNRWNSRPSFVELTNTLLGTFKPVPTITFKGAAGLVARDIRSWWTHSRRWIGVRYKN